MRDADVISGRFRLETLAGSGGMGTVWRATDLIDGGPVAVKIVRGAAESGRDRFAREAAVLAELSHPAIVRYVAHGITPSNDAYIAMEWLEGEDLSDRLARGGLSPVESVELVRRVAEALALAHAHGVVHRDVKPSNLYLPGGEISRVKVLDFGIARAAGRAAVTRTGSLLGTPGFMAPEQARGARDIDARADVFALGCVLFECLTGRPAFVGDTPVAVLAKILLDDAPRASTLRADLPEALDALLARMLAKDRDARPRDGREVADALASLRDVPAGGAVTPPAVTPALTAVEQRIVSVVLAYAGLPNDDTAPTLSPDEDARSVAAARVAESFGARAEVLADGSMIIPVSGAGTVTDQAARAARCALAVRSALVDAPVVLATGRGVVTGRLPLGDVIDRAVHARATAPRDGVRIDSVTAGLLDTRFEVEGDDAGLLLVGERDDLDTPRKVHGAITTFVGREREVATLDAALGECIEEPVARVALITGTAGSGKTRLRVEFVRRALARGTPIETLLARGDAVASAAPYSLVAAAIRRAAGIRDGEPVSVRREKLSARLGRTLSGRAHAHAVDFFGELIGTSADVPSEAVRAARGDGATMGEGIRRAWESWLDAECAAQPVLLVLEDLQWADAPSVALVDHALRLLKERPFMVLALARPEVHTQFPTLWSERSVLPVPLGDLTRKSCEKLARQVLGENADIELVARVVDRAQGNAFVLEEILRAVASGAKDIPDSVLGMVQARLDSLTGDARRVLRAASVFGQTFWRGSVLALLGGEQRTTGVTEWLHDLCAREVVTRSAESRFAGEDEYTFQHAIVRDAAYAMLTDADRALGHTIAAEWLQVHGESEPLRIAEHLVRGSKPADAAVWFFKAAEKAVVMRDLETTAQLAERGIACGAAGEVLGSLRYVQLLVHEGRGEFARAVESGLAAIEGLPPKSALGLRSRGILGGALLRMNEFERARPLEEGLFERIDDPDAERHRVVVLTQFARHLTRAGRDADARRFLDALEAAIGSSPIEDPSIAMRVAELRARVAQRRGALGESIASQREAVDYATRLQLMESVIQYVHLGAYLVECGFFDEAETWLSRALQDRGDRMFAVAGYGRVLLDQARFYSGGSIDFAKSAQFAMEAHAKQRAGIVSAVALLAASEFLEAGGDLVGAERCAAESAEFARTGTLYVPVALAARARILLAMGRNSDALAAAESASAAMKPDEYLHRELVARAACAEVFLVCGADEAARSALSIAASRLETLAASFADPSDRERFRAAFPAHRRIAQWAATGTF